MKNQTGSRLIIFSSIFFTSFFAHAGFFGPKTYEECVLKGMKDAQTESAATFINDACERKFRNKTKPGDPQAPISNCSVVWMGNQFARGKPLDESKYTMIRFKSSPDNVYFPTQMPLSDMKKNILQNRDNILKLCPGVTFD